MLLLCGAAACASILGDYTKGDELTDGGGGDARNNPLADGSSSGDIGDSTSPTDAPSGSSSGDGGADADAAPRPPVLTCSFQPNSTLLLANFQRASQNTPDEIYLLGPTATNQNAYVIVPGGPNSQGADVYRYTASESSPSVLDIPSPPGQIYDAHRTPDGIVMLAMDYGGVAGHSQLVVFKLSESVTDAGIPVWQRIPIGPLDPVPFNTCRQIATFLVVDSTTDDYIAALSYNPAPSGCSGSFGPPVLFVARTGTAPDGGASAPLVQWDIPPADGGILALDFARDSIVLDPGSSKVYLFVDPSEGSGPVTGVGPIVFSSPATLPEGGATAQSMSLGGAPIFASGLGYISSPTLGGIDVGLLSGDLSLALPTLDVGNIPAASVATTPITSAYRANGVSGVEALPVDKGRSHWHAFSGGEHLLLIGRNDIKGGNGVNLYWFDQAGNVRVQQAATDGGPDHSALLQNHVVVGADVTFNGPPTGSPAVLGDLIIALTEQTDAGGGVNYYSLTQYHSLCTP
jgi:hypothetical protein